MLKILTQIWICEYENYILYKSFGLHVTVGICNVQTYPAQCAESVRVYQDWKAVPYHYANETL